MAYRATTQLGGHVGSAAAFPVTWLEGGPVPSSRFVEVRIGFRDKVVISSRHLAESEFPAYLVNPTIACLHDQSI